MYICRAGIFFVFQFLDFKSIKVIQILEFCFIPIFIPNTQTPRTLLNRFHIPKAIMTITTLISLRNIVKEMFRRLACA